MNRLPGPLRQGSVGTVIEGPSDAELLAAIADGDRRALEVLYRRHAPWIALRLGRRCADPDLADAALADTFVAVWRRPGSYRAQGEVAAWLWGIAIRRLIDLLRRQGIPVAAAEVAETAGAAAVSAEEQVLAGVEHGDLAGALNRLSPELRAVVQATVLDGLTTREAARLLGIPPGTVKTRMMRAKPLLRQALV